MTAGECLIGMRRAILCCALAACSSHTPAPAPPAAPRDADSECGPVSVYQESLQQIAVYCAHVDDRCCRDGEWNCDNVNYIGWYAKYCAR